MSIIGRLLARLSLPLEVVSVLLLGHPSCLWVQDVESPAHGLAVLDSSRETAYLHGDL